jgi:acid phosphatase class B
MLFYSELLFYIGLHAVNFSQPIEVYPCSPIEFINESITNDWIIYSRNNQPTYNNIAYDYDDTIYIKNSNSDKSVATSFNSDVIEKISDDLKLGRNVFIISNRGEKDRYEIIENLGLFLNIQLVRKIKIILLGDTEEIKAKYIESNNVEVFYGDSDSDMRNAIMGGAVPVRILRGKRSQDRGGANIGIFKELIMGCSQRAY